MTLISPGALADRVGPRTSRSLLRGWVVDALATGEHLFFIFFTIIIQPTHAHARTHAHKYLN